MMGETENLIAIYVVWSASYASTKTLDSARGESHHPAFDGNWPTIIRMFLALSTSIAIGWVLHQGNENVESDQDFILLSLCMV